MNDKEMVELKEFIRQELKRHTATLYWEISRLPLTYDDKVTVHEGLLTGERYPGGY